MEGSKFACLLKEVTGIVTREGGDVDKECIANWGCHERTSWGSGRALMAKDVVVVDGTVGDDDDDSVQIAVRQCCWCWLAWLGREML
jgi:hypothetical protein